MKAIGCRNNKFQIESEHFVGVFFVAWDVLGSSTTNVFLVTHSAHSKKRNQLNASHQRTGNTAVYKNMLLQVMKTEFFLQQLKILDAPNRNGIKKVKYIFKITIYCRNVLENESEWSEAFAISKITAVLNALFAVYFQCDLVNVHHLTDAGL